MAKPETPSSCRWIGIASKIDGWPAPHVSASNVLIGCNIRRRIGTFSSFGLDDDELLRLGRDVLLLDALDVSSILASRLQEEDRRRDVPVLDRLVELILGEVQDDLRDRLGGLLVFWISLEPSVVRLARNSYCLAGCGNDTQVFLKSIEH